MMGSEGKTTELARTNSFVTLRSTGPRGWWVRTYISAGHVRTSEGIKVPQ